MVGHSLGSVILFDLLAHQRGHGDDRVFSPLVRTLIDVGWMDGWMGVWSHQGRGSYFKKNRQPQGLTHLHLPNPKTNVKYIQDAAIHYPQLQFPVDLFVTMGSPIGLFLVVREQARFGGGGHA